MIEQHGKRHICGLNAVPLVVFNLEPRTVVRWATSHAPKFDHPTCKDMFFDSMGPLMSGSQTRLWRFFLKLFLSIPIFPELAALFLPQKNPVCGCSKCIPDSRGVQYYDPSKWGSNATVDVGKALETTLSCTSVGTTGHHRASPGTGLRRLIPFKRREHSALEMRYHFYNYDIPKYGEESCGKP
jgi:hypothetical protein